MILRYYPVLYYLILIVSSLSAFLMNNWALSFNIVLFFLDDRNNVLGLSPTFHYVEGSLKNTSCLCNKFVFCTCRKLSKVLWIDLIKIAAPLVWDLHNRLPYPPQDASHLADDAKSKDHKLTFHSKSLKYLWGKSAMRIFGKTMSMNSLWSAIVS